jgi:AraC-like DNA-binding protein
MLQIKLVNDRSEIFDKVKSVADQIIQIRLDTGICLVFSTQISVELKVDYNAFSNLFLSEYGVTPERVFVIRLIEKVKELLVYTEQSFRQIANALGYNNPSSLSNTLKKYTGFTSTYFKEIRKNKLEIIRRQQLGKSEI